MGHIHFFNSVLNITPWEWKRLKGWVFSPTLVRPVPGGPKEVRKPNPSNASLPGCLFHGGILGGSQTKRHQRHLVTFFDPSIYWQGLGKHLVDNAPSVGILSCSKNSVDARDKNIQQRAKSLSLAGASGHLKPDIWRTSYVHRP